MTSSLVSVPRVFAGARALPFLLTLLAVWLPACGASPATELGALQLGLTTQAGGVTYRLGNARLLLEGPEKRELSADDEDELELALPAGAYRLTLLEGFSLLPKDQPGATPAKARLISQNPAPVLVSAGEVARVTLRFELEGGGSVALGDGTLQVGIEIGSADAGASAASACTLGVRIDELDYEQTSADDGELIELLNTSKCAAPLDDVVLELVNGGDGKVYTRYPLHDIAPLLAPGERLVLADEKVLATLPGSVKRFMLNGSGLQNGPDGVRLLRAGKTLDAVQYEDKVAGSGEGDATVADEGEQSLSRCPSGFDTDDNAIDFQLGKPTPGAASDCP